MIHGPRVKADGLTVVADRFGDATKGLVSRRDIAVEIGFAGQPGNGLTDQVDGEFRLAGIVGHYTQQVQRVRLTWLNPKHLSIEGLGLRLPTGLMVFDRLFESST
jgi:hypothetical protein